MSNVYFRLFFYAFVLSVISCNLSERENNRFKDEDFVVFKNFDKFVDIVLDKERNVYIRSTVSEQCGRGKYYYNGSVVLGDTLHKRLDEYEDLLEVPLSSMVDLDSLKLVKLKERYYTFEDTKYVYDMHIMMCESNIVVDIK